MCLTVYSSYGLDLTYKKVRIYQKASTQSSELRVRVNIFLELIVLKVLNSKLSIGANVCLQVAEKLEYHQMARNTHE
jgi:hypothetical protein